MPACCGMTPALADFAGDWLVSRRISDHLAAQSGSFTGRAGFRPVGGVLHYHETGMLTLGAQAPLRAERRYVWRQEAGRIVVEHSDGRAFHAFALDGGQAEAVHWCDPDHYRVHYDVSHWPEWTAEWRVSGPRKDYVMHTVYRRG